VWDELDEPLGFVSGAAAAAPAGRIHLTGTVAMGAAAVAVAIGLLSLSRRNLPLNGGPYALAKVEVLPAPRKPTVPDVRATVHETIASPIASAEQVEATSGVKVTRGSGSPPKALIIDVARTLGVTLAPAPDVRLVEFEGRQSAHRSHGGCSWR
jgi:hypothetical protein